MSTVNLVGFTKLPFDSQMQLANYVAFGESMRDAVVPKTTYGSPTMFSLENYDAAELFEKLDPSARATRLVEAEPDAVLYNRTKLAYLAAFDAGFYRALDHYVQARNGLTPSIYKNIDYKTLSEVILPLFTANMAPILRRGYEKLYGWPAPCPSVREMVMNPALCDLDSIRMPRGADFFVDVEQSYKDGVDPSRKQSLPENGGAGTFSDEYLLRRFELAAAVYCRNNIFRGNKPEFRAALIPGARVFISEFDLDWSRELNFVVAKSELYKDVRIGGVHHDALMLDEEEELVRGSVLYGIGSEHGSHIYIRYSPNSNKGSVEELLKGLTLDGTPISATVGI